MTLQLPIYYHTPETRQAKETGMSYSIKECKQRLIIFYHISCIGDYIDEDGNEYTEIHANGELFICPLKASDVANLIEKARKKELIFN